MARAQKGGAAIAYYAGAVTILFSLFASTHGALTLVDERRAGIADRILAGRYGMAPVVTGKFVLPDRPGRRAGGADLRDRAAGLRRRRCWATSASGW